MIVNVNNINLDVYQMGEGVSRLENPVQNIPFNSVMDLLDQMDIVSQLNQIPFVQPKFVKKHLYTLPLKMPVEHTK